MTHRQIIASLSLYAFARVTQGFCLQSLNYRRCLRIRFEVFLTANTYMLLYHFRLAIEDEEQLYKYTEIVATFSPCALGTVDYVVCCIDICRRALEWADGRGDGKSIRE